MTLKPMSNYSPETLQTLAAMVPTYVWWKTPEEALRHPDRVIAQVMNLGTAKDVDRLTATVGLDVLRHVLTHAQAGQFSPQQWAHWHIRLGLAQPGTVPPLPVRTFDST